MTQFDPSMVAQMLMQPIQRASENLGGGPFGIGADAGGSYFVDPEVAARTGYGTAVTGTSFFPGAGIVDAYGGAVDISGQPLPSFGENIKQGNYLDAALQGLGVAGDMATFAAPATLGASALVGALLKGPGAARKVTKATDVASDVGSIAKVEPPTETQPGIIVFHGSGADFDEFKLEKIGTGEGAQAFGYGLYFTDSEDIGKFYKNQILKTQNVEYKGQQIKFLGDDAAAEMEGNELLLGKVRDRILGGKFNSKQAIDSVINEYEQTIENSFDLSQPFANVIEKENYESIKADLEYLKTLKADDFNYQEGKLYKVAIQPKADELLDYDKPLSEQPKILEKLENAFGAKELNVLSLKNAGLDSEKLSGRRLYELLKDEYGGDKLASEELSKSGTKGIKYKSGQISGIKDSEATNFVIFDDKLIKILEKYGIVGPVAVSATAAALRDDDGST